MKNWLKQLDDLLRGEATLMSSLHEGRIDTPVGGLAIVTIGLGAIYGACMGSYGALAPEGAGLMQILAGAVKLPLLFFLTLLVTFPSLYVFNALVGSRLSMESVLRLLVAMLGVMLAVLSSLGPIIVFFSLSTTSYPFMKLLNVVACGVAGFLGLAFLLRTLHRLVLVQEQLDEARQTGKEAESSKERRAPSAESGSREQPPAGEEQPGSSSEEPHPARQAEGWETESSGAKGRAETGSSKKGDSTEDPPPPREPQPEDTLEQSKRERLREKVRVGAARSPAAAERHAPWALPTRHGALDLVGAETSQRARTVFNIWVVVFALVGAQMSWVLRPFIGSPDLTFQWFRPREGNFFQAVVWAIWHLFN